MNKNTLLSGVTVLAMAFALTACNTTTPDQYFDIAVLNTNLISGFANGGDFRLMETPMSALQKDNTVAPQKRTEFVEQKIQSVEGALEKVKALPEDEETKPMKDASVALYEYVLPVYKNEYVALAKKYDAGAGKEEVEQDMIAINDKYFPKFDELSTKLTDIGKVYAAKYGIKVEWGTH